MKWLPAKVEQKAARNTAKGQVFHRSAMYPQESTWGPDRAYREAMQRVTWVFRCVDAIAGNQAKLPFILRSDDSATGKEITNHSLLPLLNSRTNIGEDSNAFRYRLSSQLLLSNRGVFIEVVRNRAREVIAMILLPPQHTSPIPDPRTFVAGYKIEVPGERGIVLPPDRVVWLRKPHPFDPYQSLTPLESAGLAIETDYLAKLYNRNFLINDGRPGGLVIIKGDMSEEDKEELRARYRGNINTVGRINVIASEQGADFVDVAVNPRDAQYTDMRDITRTEILMAFGVPETVLGNSSGRCVDMETEALTQRGWLRGDEITTHDTILSMNPTTGRLIWSPIHEVYRAHYAGPMYRLKNKHTDFLVTPGHKWAMCDGSLKKVEDIGNRERIRSMGDAENSVIEPAFSSAFVELVGWAVTEGYYYPNEWSRAHQPTHKAPFIRIRQKEGPNLDRIRACLKEVGARFIERVDTDRPMYRWDVRGEIAAALQEVSPNRVMSLAFLAALTAAQRELLLQTMIDADGARQKSTASWIFTQKDEAAAEAFVFLATLAGYSTSLRYEPSREGFWRYRVIVRQRKAMTLQRNTRTIESYEGDVWCPRTNYGTFVARRDGRVVVTGNTFDNAEQERLTFWMEAMSTHLELIARPLDVLDPNPKVFAGFDTSKVDVIQRAEIKRRDFLLKEWNQGGITQNMYLRETERETLAEGGDVTFIPGTYIAVGSTKKGALKEMQKIVIDSKPKPAPKAPPGAQRPGRPQDKPNDQNQADPQPTGRPQGAPKPRVVAASAGGGVMVHPEQVIPIRVLVDSQQKEAEIVAIAKIGEWTVPEQRLLAFKQHTLAEYERWETVFETTMQRFFERQYRVVREKFLGARLKRRWEQKGAEVLDAIYDQKIWDQQLEDDMAPVLAGVMKVFGDEIVDRLDDIATFDPNSEAATRLRERQLQRILHVNRTTHTRLQEVLTASSALGAEREYVADQIGEVFQDSIDVRTVVIAKTEIVAAAASGKLAAAEPTEETLRKVWVTIGDSHVRPLHDALDGQTVGLDEKFTYESTELSFPGDPAGDGEEVIGCRCAVLLVNTDGPLL